MIYIVTNRVLYDLCLFILFIEGIPMKFPIKLFIAFLLLHLTQTAFATQRIAVAAGSFQMGCSQGDTQCATDEGKAGGVSVNVPVFFIDRNEVTVSEYKKCITAGQCERPKDHQRNKYCNLDAEGRNNHPINCVDWKDALAYCKWTGGRLPLEAEWEKAARAGTNRAYPWGNNVSCKQAILDDGVTQGSVKDEPDGCGEDRTWPIHSRAANALGLFDMHGNVGEWMGNWYSKDALVRYAKGDLQGATKGQQRVVRGGSWDENIPNLRSSFRNVKPPVSGDSVYGSIGFRCVADR